MIAKASQQLMDWNVGSESSEGTAGVSKFLLKPKGTDKVKKKKQFGGGKPKLVIDNGRLDSKIISKGLKLNLHYFICDRSQFARDCLGWGRSKTNLVRLADGRSG